LHGADAGYGNSHGAANAMRCITVGLFPAEVRNGVSFAALLLLVASLVLTLLDL
jgi:hypothetical protein